MKAWLLPGCFLMVGALSQSVWALTPCQRDTAVGSWCEAGIETLHPTQGGVGQL
ncbi:chromosome partitioning protein ParB, partial [Aeromonas sp. HMWF016]